jgi:MoaA/NifB/PqqE/SkfB family radical SAM enzyme
MFNEIANNLNLWFRGLKQPPYELEVRVTNRCNLNCLFCGNKLYADKSSEIDDLIFKRVIREACEMGVKYFHFCGGGEPLIRKSLVNSLIAIAKNYNRYVKLITNGTLLDEKTIKNLVKINLDELTISIDGPTAKVHDYLRGTKGSFNRICQSVNRINYYKKVYGKNKPKLIIALVLTNKNFDKIDTMIKFAHYKGFSEVCIQPMIIVTPEANLLKLSKVQQEEFKKMLPNLERLARKYKIKCNIQDFYNIQIIEKSSQKDELIKKENKNFPFCFYPWFYCGVFADGTTAPCPDAPSGFFENIQTKTLKEIWYGEKFKKFRKRIFKGQLFTWCKNCCGNKFFENQEIKKILSSNF